MLTNVTDKTNAVLETRRAIPQVVKDVSVSASERSKKIQDIMVGRVKIPSPKKKATAASLSVAETDATAAKGSRGRMRGRQ